MSVDLDITPEGFWVVTSNLLIWIYDKISALETGLL